MSEALQITFDLVPIILAMIAILCLRDCNNSIETKIARSCAILLIICQSTWMQSYLIDFPMFNTVADKLWTIFNSMTMIFIIRIALRKDK